MSQALAHDVTAYLTASGSSNSPRADGAMVRQALKIDGPNRQQFMLTRGRRQSART